ncbi:MAG: hypothetical protein JXA21_29150 [Anaerolineae bacterium]|nr:hypothetical protein [Anaerolineae bacterium]
MSSINRRNFLHMAGIGLARGLLGNTSYTPYNVTLSPGTRTYQGVNLTGWTVIVGDAARPGQAAVTTADIQTVQFTEYSEVHANIQARPEVMVHNLSFHKVFDDRAFDFVHICEYKFRLPYLPSTGNTDYNGQTVEGCLALWNGTTRQNYTVGFQWIVNPYWMTGALQCWTTDKWQPVGEMALDTEWHTVKMIIDCQRETTGLQIDSGCYPSSFTETTGPADWGTEIATWISAEAISIDPGEDFTGGMPHKAQFKDWTWTWEPANTSCIFLPLVQK